jgi:thioredoxin-like negative regulator of GroEL
MDQDPKPTFLGVVHKTGDGGYLLDNRRGIRALHPEDAQTLLSGGILTEAQLRGAPPRGRIAKRCERTVRDVSPAEVKELFKNSPRPVIAQFHGTWCGACAATNPEVDALARHVCEDADVVRVNVDDANKLADDLGIESVPAVMLVHRGKVYKKVEGDTTADKFAKLFDAILKRLK